MAATVTLSTTTLTRGIGPRDRDILLSSVSGVRSGLFLFMGRELMRVDSVLSNGLVRVVRGVNGTSASDHSPSEVVTIGAGDQFYVQDPTGSPASDIAVSPWINVRNGKVWYAQGDAGPVGLTFRWWAESTTTYSTGALGVRVSSASPTAST